MSPGEFWHQTPRIFAAIMDAMIRKSRAAHNHRVQSAWYIANFSRAEKLPALDTFLIDISTGKARGNGQLDPDDGLDAWFNVLEQLNKG